ncbi:MAG: protein kinase [Myxococcota bacterium]
MSTSEDGADRKTGDGDEAELTSPSDSELGAGEVVGEYVIERRLGRGSFGDVYAAEHPVIGKRAAVKVLHARFSREPQVVSRFISEARAVNRIRHRNIIDIFSFGQLDNGQQYFIMELLYGETLGDLLQRRGSLDVDEVCRILRGVADALDAAHLEQITHRDLKPDNIFLARERDGTIVPKLLDFGIAKLIDDETVQHKTSTGMALGTPLYMSPEQCRNRAVDHRADIYSLGVVAFQMLTGTIPFTGESVVDVLFHHIGTAPPDLSEVSTLPVTMDPPVREMLAKRPTHRPPSAGDALDRLALAASTSGFNVPWPPPRAVATTRDGYAAPTAPGGEPTKPSDDDPDAVSDTEAPPPSDRLDSDPGRTLPEPGPAPDGREERTIPSQADPVLPAPGPRPDETLSTTTPLSVASPMKQLGLAALALIGLTAGYFALRAPEEEATSTSGAERATASDPSAVASTRTPTEAEPTPSAEASAEASVAPQEDASPPPVRVTVKATPAGVAVWRGGARLEATSPGVIELPRGDDPIQLTFKHAGYFDQALELTPNENQTVSFTMQRRPRAGLGRPPSPPPVAPPPPPPPPAPFDPRLEDR